MPFTVRKGGAAERYVNLPMEVNKGELPTQALENFCKPSSAGGTQITIDELHYLKSLANYWQNNMGNGFFAPLSPAQQTLERQAISEIGRMCVPYSERSEYSALIFAMSNGDVSGNGVVIIAVAGIVLAHLILFFLGGYGYEGF